ncbi:MAG: SPFH domain-containing protein [Planctomycetota bacterium]|jgi:regulator of protease activity HflC (stomatin/prohibitin superfamily)
MGNALIENHLEDLRRQRRAAGWALMLVALPAAAFGLWAGRSTGLAVLGPLGGVGFLTAAATLAVFGQLRWREREWPARVRGSADQELPERPLRVTGWVRSLPWLAGLATLAVLLRGRWAGALIEAWEALEPYLTARELQPEIAAGGLLAGALLIAAAGAVLAPYFSGAPEAVAPETRGLARWFRALAWFALIAAVSLGLRQFDEPRFEALTGQVLRVGLWILAVEVLARAAFAGWMRFYEGVQHPGAPVLTDLFSLRLLADSLRPLNSFFGTLADAFGIDLRGTWALDLARRSALPLTLLLALLGWLSSSLVVVPLGKVGVVERFGARVSDDPIGPGLHVGLPWPMQVTRRVDTGSVRSLNLGFDGDTSDFGRLWDRPHAEEEYTLLLGNGSELVSVTGYVQWRVADAVQYVYGHQNPDDTVERLAGEVLLERTSGRRLDDVLNANLAQFAAAVEGDLQAACEREGLGVEVVDLTLVGLHPPVAVATDYQDVVASQIEAETRIAEAEAAATKTLGEALGEAVRLAPRRPSRRAWRPTPPTPRPS